jgi:hypothetical protein
LTIQTLCEEEEASIGSRKKRRPGERSIFFWARKKLSGALLKGGEVKREAGSGVRGRL